MGLDSSGKGGNLSYDWNDLKLRKLSRIYTWLALLVMVGALVSISVFPHLSYIALICAGIAFVLMVLGSKAQSKDKKLKKDKKELTTE